ncbi:right-handed parallel beta-helix repeat-containing protein [Noviherbaspirillum agri]
MLGLMPSIAFAVSRSHPGPTSPVYYISPNGNDANAGTARAPWRSIQKAADTTSAGATVILLDGIYEEPSITFHRSGTADKPITFRAKNKWKAVVASTSGCNPAFSIKASYITVKDIRFSVSPRNITCPIFTSANAAIRAWEATVPNPSNPNTGHVGFVADGIKVDAGPERADGVKSNQDYSIIQNSEIGQAVVILNTRNSIIRNNLIFGQNKYGASILAKGGVRNAQIYGNIIRNKSAKGQAIYIGGYSCDDCHFDTETNIEAYNSVAYNNVVINESGADMVGLILQGAKDSAFFNNIVVGGQISMQIGGHNSGPQAPVHNPTFKNNIVICDGRPAKSRRGWNGNYTGALSVDHNNFHDCKDVPHQKNPVAGDPLLVNRTSDWRLQSGSPAISAGTPISFKGFDGDDIDISRDRDGAIRTTPWDLGVYRYKECCKGGHSDKTASRIRKQPPK